MGQARKFLVTSTYEQSMYLLPTLFSTTHIILGMRRDSVKGVVSVTPVHVTTQRKRSAREAERRGLGGETEAERTELGGRTGAERTELGGWEAEEEGTPSPKRLNITTS